MATPAAPGAPCPRRLLLFTKPGVPGRVKTRLTTELTPEQAAAVHRAFVGDLVERLAAGPFDLRIAWALEPDEPLPTVAEGGPAALRQEGTDLGERLFRGLSAAAALDGGARAVAALGSDHPTVDLEVLAAAFERVEAGADVVLGPSFDGGYYLIVTAASALRPELFAGIDWSTERVLEQTVARIEAAGLRLQRVAPALDVDTPEDLRRLAAELAAAAPELCPRTRRVLSTLGLGTTGGPGPDAAGGAVPAERYGA